MSQLMKAIDVVTGVSIRAKAKVMELLPLDLVAKAQELPNPFNEQPLMGMFSHTGFDDALMSHAAHNNSLILIDKGNRVA